MVKELTTLEKSAIKAQRKKEKDTEIYTKYLEYAKTNSTTDAVTLVTNEFGISKPTFYDIKKRVNNL